MSLYSALVTQSRLRLDEAVARRWSDAQILSYVSQSVRRLAGKISRIPKSRRFRNLHVSATIAANAETFDLQSLAATKPFDWLISVSVLVASVEVELWNFEDGETAALRNLGLGGGSIISRIDLQDDNLVILPKFQTARTFYVNYAWLPAVQTDATKTVETPNQYDLDVVNWAVWYAHADAGIVNTSIETQLATRDDEIMDLERSRRGISNEMVIQRGRWFAGCR